MDRYNGTRFIYVRNGKRAKGKKGTISVAYRFNDEARVVEYNTAECGKKDTFSRKVGRAVAMGRLFANKASHPNKTVPYSQVMGNNGEPSYSAITAHLLHVHSNPSAAPVQARRYQGLQFGGSTTARSTFDAVARMLNVDTRLNDDMIALTDSPDLNLGENR